MKNYANSYRTLMEREEYRMLISFLREAIEDYLEIPPSKRSSRDKKLYDYSRALLKMATKRKKSFEIIDKMAKLQ